MRNLYIMRGAPGSGKSTFIQQAGLEAYTIEPDAVRTLIAAPVLTLAGDLRITQEFDRETWDIVMTQLESRMKRGELIMIDATHTTAQPFRTYKLLANRYRYTCYVIDLADSPLETVLTQNRSRADYKIVSDEVIKAMHQRIAEHTIPKGWHIIRTQAELAATLDDTPIDLSQYDTIHHIGDIQGVHAPLARYLAEHPFRETDAYIFVGDLIDRGPDNDKVMQTILSTFLGRDNVFFVEGNHDAYLWNWASGQPVTTREFTNKTKPQLETAGISKPDVYRLMQSARPVLYYTYDDKRVLVTHGGLSTLPTQLSRLSAHQCIRGVGRYEDARAVDDMFVKNTDSTTYQIHGHRNKSNDPTEVNERCFNLEGSVEFGGELRIVTLSRNGFTVASEPSPETSPMFHAENTQFLQSLRNSPYIREATLSDSISSFNFTPVAMRKGKWSAMTTKALGLFIQTLSQEIVIRSYDKFFNIGEKRQTEYENLRDELTFPVTAYVKENGYLGLLGYDSLSDSLIFASKSTTSGMFAENFRRLFEHAHHSQTAALKTLLRAQNITLVFEVIDPTNDPHIIEYADEHIVLLEAIHRTQEFSRCSDDELASIAQSFGFTLKKKAAEFASWEEFDTWYHDVMRLDYCYEGATIEGFVLCDATGWHIKAKLPYYLFWKQIRSQLHRLQTGKPYHISEYAIEPDAMRAVLDPLVSLSPDELPSLFELQRQHPWS